MKLFIVSLIVISLNCINIRKKFMDQKKNHKKQDQYQGNYYFPNSGGNKNSRQDVGQDVGQDVQQTQQQEDYKIDSYLTIIKKLKQLYQQHKHKNIIRLTTSQQLYGLENADFETFSSQGDFLDPDFETSSKGDCQGVQCQTPIVFLTDFSSDIDEIRSRSQVYFSGALHGNERVGPNSCLAAIQLFLENYSESGDGNQWIQYLLKNRLIVFTPVTNAQGYALDQREEKVRTGLEELTLDPNRDFPYLLGDPKKCLQTVTGRTVFNLMLNHIFSIIITFHAGETSITYPWGGDNHYSESKFDNPPDLKAFQKFVKVLKIVAGDRKNVKEYRVGNINQVVYGGKGCMEDWGYAAGWEYGTENGRTTEQINIDENMKQQIVSEVRTYNPSVRANDRELFEYWPLLKTCQIDGNSITQTSGIRMSHNITTEYKDYGNIKPNLVLIETSDMKDPSKEMNDFDGSYQNPQPLGVNNHKCFLEYYVNSFQKDNISENDQSQCNQQNGHISRNLKIILASIDLASPYLNILPIEVTNNKNKNVKFFWRVGGTIDVNKTFLMWNFYDEFKKMYDSESIKPYLNQMSEKDSQIQRFQINKQFLYQHNDLDLTFNQLKDKMLPKQTQEMNGKGVWYFEGVGKNYPQKVTNFEVNFEYVSDRKKVFLVVAMTDQDFGDRVQASTNSAEGMLNKDPITIFSNYRSNAKYFEEFKRTTFDNQKVDFKLVSHKYVYSDFYVI